MFGVFDNVLVRSPSLRFLHLHFACIANVNISCHLEASFHRELKFTVHIICTESQDCIGMHIFGSYLSSLTSWETFPLQFRFGLQQIRYCRICNSLRPELWMLNSPIPNICFKSHMYFWSWILFLFFVTLGIQRIDF